MVLVLGVSAGASGARAILTHSDQPNLPPIDRCFVPRPAGASLDDAVVVAIRKMRAAAERRGELISATAVACRNDACAEAIRAAQPRLGGHGRMQVVGESVAQLRYLSFVNQLPSDGSVVLYDLGSSGLTLTLADCPTGIVRKTKRSTTLCGDGFDSLLQWKLARLGIVIDGDTSRRHREALSVEGVITAEDRKSGRRVVFTNGDFADLAHAGLQHSVTSVNQLIERADPKPDRIVLLGGCARNRQLLEQLSAMQDLEVQPEPEPELVSARGAALLAVDRPARAVRIARAISVGAPVVGSVPERTSKRKVIAALAVTGALGATIAGLIVTDPPTGNSGQSTGATPLDSGSIPQQPFK
jgi:molecular chaperone HscA